MEEVQKKQAISLSEVKEILASLTMNSAIDFELRKCCPNNLRFIIS